MAELYPADVKAIIRLNGLRQTPAADGYRPAHRIKPDYLTTGIPLYRAGFSLSRRYL